MTTNLLSIKLVFFIGQLPIFFCSLFSIIYFGLQMLNLRKWGQMMSCQIHIHVYLVFILFFRRTVVFSLTIATHCVTSLSAWLFSNSFSQMDFFYMLKLPTKLHLVCCFSIYLSIQDNLTCAVKFSRTVSVSFWLCANSSLSSIIFWFRWEICCSRWEILSLQVDLISVSCCLVSSSFFSRVLLCPIQHSF